MIISIPMERLEGQSLVACSPDAVSKLIRLGYDVYVERGAGQRSDYPDEQYEKAGASIVSREEAWFQKIIVCLDIPHSAEFALIGSGTILVTRAYPQDNPEFVDACVKRGITLLSTDMVPRISRAQSLDVRSSMTNVAGYKAVIEAANAFGKLFSGQVTAAGKVNPAYVYVIGVGVAGLAAIGTASSMGAIVSATDVRADVADQVESLGASFVEIPVKQESADGYAKALDENEQEMVLAVYSEQAAKSDIVITTAQVPGKPAPLLITAEAVSGMKPGSVIVDMGASELGGNCELSKPDDIVVTDNGVTIIGYTDLAGRMPGQASQLYGQNMVNLFKLLTPDKDGVPVLDEDDEIIRTMMVSRDGTPMYPPPPVSVSVAPQEQPAVAEEPAASISRDDQKGSLGSIWWKALAAVLAVLLIAVAPAEMTTHFIVFELAVVVGFYVITSVTHALHTPLMSVTNAISGIIIVGACLLVGASNPVVVVLSVIAMILASINIFGGFIVTRRMLKMFDGSSED